MNHRAKYLGQRSFHTKVILRTHTHTHTHTHTQRSDNTSRTTNVVGNYTLQRGWLYWNVRSWLEPVDLYVRVTCSESIGLAVTIFCARARKIQTMLPARYLLLIVGSDRTIALTTKVKCHSPLYYVPSGGKTCHWPVQVKNSHRVIILLVTLTAVVKLGSKFVTRCVAKPSVSPHSVQTRQC